VNVMANVGSFMGASDQADLSRSIPERLRADVSTAAVWNLGCLEPRSSLASIRRRVPARLELQWNVGTGGVPGFSQVSRRFHRDWNLVIK